MTETKNNGIAELNAHLFKQLDRLNDPACDLELELKRAKASVDIGNVIINSAKVTVDAMRLVGAKSNSLLGISGPDEGQKQLSNGE